MVHEDDTAHPSQDPADPGQHIPHKSDTVTGIAKGNGGGLRLEFLPSHTQQINQIEQQWNVLKRIMFAGRHFASVGEMRGAIAAIARRRRMRPVWMMNH